MMRSVKPPFVMPRGDANKFLVTITGTGVHYLSTPLWAGDTDGHSLVAPAL